MSDFLLEIRCQEIPARMQAGARADLDRLFRKEMEAAGVTFGQVTVWSTPRRLALIARDLPAATQAIREEEKGPPVGAPDQAIDGFCRKNGVSREQLQVRELKGRETYFAVKDVAGRAVRDVLAEAIPAMIRAFPWPKSMRWGPASLTTESLRWVRPLSGIVAIFGEDLVECEVGGIASGYATLGHRFHCPGPITIGSAADYQEKLRACHVIVDHSERQDLIREEARFAATDAGLVLVEDEGLVIENAGLTEWPVPLLGRFDQSFLDVPPEVIQLTARVNQKYFVCENDGQLANAFVCTANIEAADGGAAIVDGNRKVLAARLSDARFFWEQDRKVPLAQQAKKLERITFHEKLGTVADKVERVAKLARWLVEEGIVKSSPGRGGEDPEHLADMAEQAARLAKADLVTEMVGEFPELQGLMGGYYARAEGLPAEVADAIRDHYKPVGQDDDVPTAPVTVAVSLADKLDTLVSFFVIKERPTGSRDPFALRRAALGIIEIVLRNGLRLELDYAAAKAGQALSAQNEGRVGAEANAAWIAEHLTAELFRAVPEFFVDRLKVQQREAGVRHDVIDAVFMLGKLKDDLVGNLARVKALQNFVATEDGANLLAAYKRAANILKKEDWHGLEGEIAQTGEEDPLALVDDPDLAPVIAAKMAERHRKELSYKPEPAEQALVDALDFAAPKAAAAVEAEDFEAAMAALASLRAPIDRFFDEVTVNDDDSAKRGARLDLLARFRAAVHEVADFSRIEG
ncbi:glycine--tRNA ligase subunit beta [Altererythrobacter soli]|uniref:Glycine--tRNA ligase beta subunit n=1 Tax=Croceibacterium soli TaxID=1739690 RepID=A0A6I4UWN2_9SPHN|nr:glycine--tRNA ligase subunit beta [Croceibacterium soli]MXP42304.1 glycine--tRNA ligase subunit beta [Croceibacterium soli]